MSGPGAQPVVSNLMTHAFTTFYHEHHLQFLLNGLYLNALHLNQGFSMKICVLPMGSITRRTCVLSIIPVCTVITITQVIRSGGCGLKFFQNSCKLLPLQCLRALQPAGDKIFIQKLCCGAIGCKAGNNVHLPSCGTAILLVQNRLFRRYLMYDHRSIDNRASRYHWFRNTRCCDR